MCIRDSRKAGTLRAQHPALRRGVRTNVVVEDWYWVYKVSDGSDEVFVAINRDNPKSWSPPACPSPRAGAGAMTRSRPPDPRPLSTSRPSNGRWLNDGRSPTPGTTSCARRM